MVQEDFPFHRGKTEIDDRRRLPGGIIPQQGIEPDHQTGYFLFSIFQSLNKAIAELFTLRMRFVLPLYGQFNTAGYAFNQGDGQGPGPDSILLFPPMH